MRLDINTGWVEGILNKQSPHCDARPDRDDFNLLVIHNISLPPGEFDKPYIDQMFMGELKVEDHSYFATINPRVSAHFLINRDGIITQYVSIYDRAWHAGLSHFEGRDKCNDFSLGIELEGTDEIEFTESQYQALGKLVNELLNKLPSLSQSRIVGHSDIAPGRKTDPGPYFNWDYFFRKLKEE